MDLNSEDIPNDFEFNNDESAINTGNQSIKKDALPLDKTDNDKKCIMCHTGKKKPIELTCKHKVHKGCLLTKIQQGLVNCKYKIKWPDPDWDQAINESYFLDDLKDDFVF